MGSALEFQLGLPGVVVTVYRRTGRVIIAGAPPRAKDWLLEMVREHTEIAEKKSKTSGSMSLEEISLSTD